MVQIHVGSKPREDQHISVPWLRLCRAVFSEAAQRKSPHKNLFQLKPGVLSFSRLLPARKYQPASVHSRGRSNALAPLVFLLFPFAAPVGGQ
jgi:hypothetical protein